MWRGVDLEYKEIEDLARTKAKEIAGVTDLTFKISNRLKRWHALCYWNEKPCAIHLSKRFVDLNKDNYQIITELIIHECIHLIPGCDRHNKKFNRYGKRYGISVYGYSTNFIPLKPLFATHCTKCNRFKPYYSKPRNTYCKECNGKLNIITYSDEHGN